MNRQSIRVLYIWDADYPWDIRVEKICNTLLNQGLEVHIVARNLKRLPQNECLAGIYVHRLPSWKNNKINYAVSFPLFLSPIWKTHIDTVIKKHEINLIIVRDLPMAIAGIWAGARNNIPVIFDMAENYTAMISDIWNRDKFKGINLLVRNPFMAKIIEKYAIIKFDHILVVVEEALDVLVKSGVNPDKVTIVGNTPKLKQIILSENGEESNLGIIKNHFSVIYTGGITANRGIGVVLGAIPDICKVISDFLFVIIGVGREDANITQTINRNKLDKYVLRLGWIDHDKIYTYIKACKIGLIPHIVTNHTNTTIPNKIYDYMACGIPVIASNTIPMKRIINEEMCGSTFKDGDQKDLVKAIIDMHNFNNSFGKNGEKAILSKYNWEIDEKKLIRVVEKVMKRGCGSLYYNEA